MDKYLTFPVLTFLGRFDEIQEKGHGYTIFVESFDQVVFLPKLPEHISPSHVVENPFICKFQEKR